MAAFIANIDIVWSWVFDFCRGLWSVMMICPPLAAVLALWILDHIFGIFKLVKG